MTDTPAPPRSSPLHDRHEALGASFTDFGGWNMPVRYTSDLAEHRAVREAAGLFDISHMAEFWVRDGRAADFLDYVLAGRVSAMRIGKAKYSLVLAESGGIVDDVIVYRTGEQHYLVIANASNRDAVAAAFERARSTWSTAQASVDGPPPGGEYAVSSGGHAPLVEDVTDSVALVALQGPRARGILESIAEITILSTPLDELGYYAFTEGTFDGDSLFIARTGYTGEDGYELLVSVKRAADLWDALLAAGASEGLVPCGLAARDTLRLEAGMPLYGHELSRDVTPAQAGLGRVVSADKTAFVGKDGLMSRPADAPVLVGLVSEGRRAGRAGYPVLDGDDVVGEITSGALSPTLGYPVAMAYVSPASAEPGTTLTIDVRGTRIPATVTPLPFYRRNA
ncbi:glycine cleavage system aminomethyltransferase GcvT [Microbacterium testaceum]|uniref:glycine cleavage system aminomethyltransferase GcvT n=1 Tax=Microbacterium testaceum TaxID=2033 RepID=UPI001D179662|nr:glycine cleavage system aminomethyltransferase GcvT [Microbacterium testaceum]MCC4249505.1 glycine cleavage system protein T [Microbacterium testaceum]